MSEDFFYAFLTGWIILVIFWSIIIIFIYVRKPPNSNLKNSTILKSFIVFLILLLGIYLFK